MVKQGIVNFFKSLKYFFTPLGTMFLGMMLGFSIFFPALLSAGSTLVDGVKQLSESVHLDFGILFGNIWDSVAALDWSDPWAALQTMLTAEWLDGVLTQALTTVLGTDFETFAVEIVELIAGFTAAVLAGAIMFFVMWLLGFIAGFLLLKVFIRRDIARRALWKLILATAINAVLTAAFVLLSAWLFVLWKDSIYISLLCILVFVGVFALLEAYLLHGYKKIKVAEIVNVKNACLYMLTNVIIFAISIALTLIALAVNKVLGVFIGLAFVSIAVIVVNLNAESYVQATVRQKEESAAAA